MASSEQTLDTPEGVVLHCGWGRLIFGHTFPSPESVARAVLGERENERDIAFYLNDPHLILNHAPQDLFLDPSITFRLDFSHYQPRHDSLPGLRIGLLESKDELVAVNSIYLSHRMVPVNVERVWRDRECSRTAYFVARRERDDEIVGVVLGVDHRKAFDDLLNGSSLWALAVHKQADLPGIGEALIRHVVEHFIAKGRSILDLSVMHDNHLAIQLYKKLGFEKVAVFAVKNRNPINERLFIPEPPSSDYNIYARIIIDEALRRGIRVESSFPERNHFRLSTGGRSVHCWESLTEMTSSISVAWCNDKSMTREILANVGLSVPAQQVAGDDEVDRRFLEEHTSIVVKPAEGEQGTGVAVDLTEWTTVSAAIQTARESCPKVILESYETGEDLRIIVINGEVVAAAIRKPASIIGNGKHTVRELIERLSRRRAAATDGESRVPLDGETLRCVGKAGFKMEDVPPENTGIQIRKTANLHTGGTIHDVTDILHPALRDAAIAGAAALSIPVVGFDFIVPAADQPDYVIIEANERPGLANHEPRPTATRLIDFLFPQTAKPKPAKTTA